MKFLPKGQYWTSGKKELQAVFEAFSMNNEFPPDCLQIIKEVVNQGRIEPRFSYPGKPAVFKMVSDKWGTHEPVLAFESETPDSLVETMVFSYHMNGEVSAYIEYKSAFKTQTLEYFENLGIELVEIDSFFPHRRVVMAMDSVQLKVMGNALLANNTFPKHYLKQIRELIIGKGKVEVDPKDYPGKSSTFVLEKGSWEKVVDIEDLHRKMVFNAKEPDALIHEFYLLEYQEQHIRLGFQIQSGKMGQLKKFFQFYGVNLKLTFQEQILDCYKSVNKEETVAIFNILVKHNTFPPHDLKKMQEIIKKSSEDQEPEGC